MNERVEEKVVLPKLRFPEFRNASYRVADAGQYFTTVNERNTEGGLPILAITQEQGAVPRDSIDYSVAVTDASLATYKVVRKGDFIISLRSFQGGIERSAYTGVCSPAYIILRATRDLEAEFYRHYFKAPAYIAQLNHELEGIRDGKMISYSQFARIPLPMPIVAEQRKIADCLQSLDELIAAQSEKLEALKRHKKGLLQQLLPAEGESTPRLRFPQFRGDTEWRLTDLRSVANISSGTTPPRSNKEYFEGGTIPWVKTMDLNNSQIRSTHERVTKASGVKVNPAGSVLVAMYGGFNQIGRTGLLTKPSATNQAIAVLTPKLGEVTSAYLLLWLNANVDMWKRVAASSRKDANITSGDVASFSITLPQSEEEQNAIGEAIGTVTEAVSEAYLYIEELRTHKAALMQQLFPRVAESD